MKKYTFLLALSTATLSAHNATMQHAIERLFFIKPVSQEKADLILYYAAMGDDAKATDALAQFLTNPKNPKPNPNKQLGPHGQACLHAAASSQDVAMFAYLVSLGAALDQQDSLGRTPLHYAVLTCNLTFTMFLLQAGAQSHLQDNEGKLPIDNLEHALCADILTKTLIKKLLQP